MLAVVLTAALHAQSLSLPPVTAAAPGVLLRTLDAAPYRGQSIHLRATVRLDNPGPGDRAQLFVRVVLPTGEPAFYDDMGDRPVVSSTPQPVTIEGDVAPDAVSIEIGLSVTGRSSARVDQPSFQAAPSTVPPATRDAIARMYAFLDAHAGNADALSAVVLPEATVLIAGQRTPISAILDQVAAATRKGARYESHTTITAVRLVGGEAIVTANNQTTVSSPGGSQTVTSMSRDTWVPAAGEWNLRESVLIATHLDDTAPVVSELKEAAVALPAGVSAVAAAAGNARIVALGQASYGTHEFADLNIRIIEDLIQHRGFTVVAIGASWAEARLIDDYTRTGQGDPIAAVEALNAWPWETAELLELVRWLRDWNAAPGHAPVRFAGFDVQPSPAADRLVLAYLKQYAPEEEGPAALAYSEVRDPERAVSAAAAVARSLDVKHRELVAASSDELWRDARQAAAVAWQNRRGPSFRADGMAATVVWLAAEAYPAARIVLWTHSANVSSADGAMGSLLKRRYGAQLYTIGYALRGGEVRAAADNDVTVYTLAPSPAGTGDAVLAAAALPEFFLDLRRPRSDSPLGRWLAQPHLFHLVGAIWGGETLIPQAPSKLYDGLIFVDQSHPTSELP